MPHVVVKGNSDGTETKVFGLTQKELSKAQIKLHIYGGRVGQDGHTFTHTPIEVLNVLERNFGYRIISSCGQVYQTLDELDFERGLWFAAQHGDLSRIAKLLKRGVPVDSRDTAGYTALHYAARAGHIDVCQELIAAGAIVDAKTHAGEATPLQRAAAAGKQSIVQLLLEAGANSAATDVDGRTALHRAAEEGHVAIVELLLKNNPQLKCVKDAKGRIAEECARFKCCPE